MKKFLHTIGRYWFLILVGIIIIFVIVANLGDDATSSSLPAPTPQAAAQPSTALPHPANVVSLPTGTVIKEDSTYFQGDGELTITNGNSADAVVKLISGGSSVLTVYIKANDSYTIQNINDGNYRVAFDLGTNWDSDTDAFTNDQGASFFEDILNFQTSNGQYTTYTLTLNGVEGGTAQTDNLNTSTFSDY